MTGKARAGIIRFMVVFTLLMRFFWRTLIQHGALRSGMVRWSLTALAAAWMVFSCVVAYFFLRPLGADRDKWSMMLDLSWVSTIPWVIGVFLLVKMLFSEADGALRIVSGLPVTGILRGLTIKASEMGVVLAAVTVSVFSISVSLLLSTGVDAIGLACLHLLLPALLLYAMLSLAWDLIGRAMRMLGLPQFASVTAICGLVAMLVGYAMLVLPLVMDIQERWLGGDDAILWATAVGDLAVRIGGLPTGIGASALLLAVTLADVAVSPPRYREQADYLPIHCPAAGRGDITMFAAYVLRSKDTFLESILAAALAIVLCVRGDTGFRHTARMHRHVHGPVPVRQRHCGDMEPAPRIGRIHVSVHDLLAIGRIRSDMAGHKPAHPAMGWADPAWLPLLACRHRRGLHRLHDAGNRLPDDETQSTHRHRGARILRACRDPPAVRHRSARSAWADPCRRARRDTGGDDPLLHPRHTNPSKEHAI